MLKNIVSRKEGGRPRLQPGTLRPEKLFTREAVREVGIWLIGAALMFPAALAVLMNYLTPFAPALFAVGLAAGLRPASMLLGCAAAIPIGEFSPETLMPMLGCLTAYGLSLVVRLVFDQAPSDPEGRDFRMAASAAVGALLPALIMAKGLFYNILAACTSAVIACAVAPCMYTALLICPERQRLLPDERLSAAVYMAIFILGASALPGALRHASVAVAALCALLCACSGAGFGALGGLGAGLALRACGFDPLFCAMFALPGALAGLLAPFSRYCCALGMLAGVALISAWCNGPAQMLPETVCALIASVGYCLLPEGLIDLARMPLDPAREDEERALQRQRSELRREMQALSNVFADLAAGYVHTGSAMPAEAEMVARLREKLCENCPSYAACWSGGDGTANRLLCQLLGMAFSGAMPGEQAELPPELGRQCRRAAQIPRRIGALLADYESRRRTEIKRARLTALMSAQFDQARALLSLAGGQIESGPQMDHELARLGRSALEREGLRAEYVYALGGERPEICARLARRADDSDALKRAARSIAAETGENYICLAPDGPEVRFAPPPRCQIRAGWRSVPGRADCPNGDSRAAVRLNDGRILLALSDGMGSGERAGRESAETLRLIARFLQAGVEPCAAIDAINELMLLRSGEDMFSTVDLCIVDPAGASAEFIKLGACRSYLIRAGACVRLEGGRLPLGILEEVRPVRRCVPLMKGDLLVMATDGLESGDEDEWIVELLHGVGGDAPQKVCDALVQEALSRPRPHSDDTTVLAIRVA